MPDSELRLTEQGKETLRKFDALARLAPDLGKRLIREVAEDGKKKSVELTPIDTGSLVSTARVEEELNIIKVVFGGMMAKFSKKGKSKRYVNYAQYVEEGTIHQQGQHFLLRGMFRAINNMSSIAKQAFDSWVKNVK